MIRVVLPLSLLAFTMFADTRVSADETARLRQAIETYQAAMDTSDRGQRVERFRRAESMFRSVSRTQTASAELQMCLGNAALGAERLGPAIIAFRRALEIDPDHSRARQNLAHSRSLLPDGLPTPEETISFGSVFDRFRRMRRADWFGIATLVFLLAALALAFSLRFESVLARNLGFALGACWLASIGLGLYAARAASAPIAVVVLPEVTARSADSINAPVRIAEPLPSGTELQVIEDRGDWIRVRLFDGREAWLQNSAVEIV